MGLGVGTTVAGENPAGGRKLAHAMGNGIGPKLVRFRMVRSMVYLISPVAVTSQVMCWSRISMQSHLGTGKQIFSVQHSLPELSSSVRRKQTLRPAAVAGSCAVTVPV